MSGSTRDDASRPGTDFIRQIIDRDLEAGRHDTVVTRFPPEPNGFLHIGHAKSIVLNFGIASEHEGGRCHLRFDDTNPSTEDPRYVEAIQEDVRWLGYDWGEHLYFASDYFERLYGFAVELIEKGRAYVDSQSEEAIRENRGTVTVPGTPSPYRDRTVAENLDLFRRMRAGEFDDGEHVLRAKIDMASPNMIMRDPLLYRIRHIEHYRTGNDWCIYPLYDFAHCLEDAIEHITHSLCTLEFENNREIYDWLVENVTLDARPRQYEFARLNLDYTVMSKRKLLRLVKEEEVDSWDDPRMPTIAGLRRRGFTPASIRAFCEMIGVAKADSRVDMGKLEYAIRDDLNRQAPRVLCVLRPLRVTLTNWPVDAETGEPEVDWLEAPYFPRDVGLEGSRRIPFSGELFIDEADFEEAPPKGFRRLVPGEEVRLRYGYVIRCDEVVKDEDGRVVELRCSYDPETRGGDTPDGRKVKGTIHWVSAPHAAECTVRLYDRLFTVPDPDAAVAARGEDSDLRDFLNPESLEVVSGARVEPSVLEDPADRRYQFERVGYFWRDPVGDDGALTFNRIVTLRDSWAKVGARLAIASGAGSESPVGGDSRTTGPEGGDRAPSSAGEAGERPSVSPEVKARADALVEAFGLNEIDAEILARDPVVEAFFRDAVGASEASTVSPVSLANWIINDLPPVQGSRGLDQLPFGPGELAELVALVEIGTFSSRGGGEGLERMADRGGDPQAIVDQLDLAQVSDAGALRPIVEAAVEAHPDKVAAYRGGKSGLMGFFMGAVMRETGGKADPELTKELLGELLEGE
ncbi:MAG: glutamine--tRNA ligase/YqeY domain fusion protein [Gemmatimonadales bacterium]|nr:MAG: glutamine--tRNA ligase/YqeY domain fusion protein [Gemmatimonadales bacterium]